jgi:excisionase family DNA binding protein
MQPDSIPRSLARFEWNRDPLAPVTTNTAEAARISGLSEETIRQLAIVGKLRSTMIRRTRLIFLDSLNDLLKGEAA